MKLAKPLMANMLAIIIVDHKEMILHIVKIYFYFIKIKRSLLDFRLLFSSLPLFIYFLLCLQLSLRVSPSISGCLLMSLMSSDVFRCRTKILNSLKILADTLRHLFVASMFPNVAGCLKHVARCLQGVARCLQVWDVKQQNVDKNICHKMRNYSGLKLSQAHNLGLKDV